MKFEFFEDTHGRGYVIDEFFGRDIWTFHVSTKGFSKIAYANCSRLSPHELRLADILVDDSAQPQPPAWPLSLFLSPASRRFRGMGLGTALLRRVLQVAEEQNIDMVYGRIFAKDLKRQPWLPAWYARFGFVQRPNGADVEITWRWR